jgi:hypothetical protein
MNTPFRSVAVALVVILMPALAPRAFGQSCAPGPHVPIATETTPAQLNPLIAQMRDFPTELDPRIFCDGRLKPAVRDRTMDLVSGLFARLKKSLPTSIASVAPDGTVSEVQVTWGIGAVELLGSEAGFEYDAKSDLGIHVFLSANGTICTDVTEDATGREIIDCDACRAACIADPVAKIFNKLVEFEQEPSDLSDPGSGITFYGMVVEVTFHGARGPSYQVYPSRGHWSVSEDTWVNQPVAQKDLTDPAQMLTDAMMWINRYNDLACEYIASPVGFDCDRFGDLDDELGDYRNDGIVAAGGNTRCTSNITYRLLRRLPSVNIPDTVDALEVRCSNIGTSLRTCLGDLDCNNEVNAIDLGALLAAWGPGNGPADLNGDGEVNGDDLSLLQSNWGTCR